ncbi:Nramp family divalent metal transporter [uncultured Sphingomonas sp.]|uniref:Nramp family divalent metal transporter n=1 Tax=uncultured Sphingomonas sp. TaxID=158754 RepID=UPI0035CBDC0C
MTPPPSSDALMLDVLFRSRRPSLDEHHRSVAIPPTGSWWRRAGAFAGPGYLVAVGYMDPGNWATDLAGGSAFGYTLLSVILLSSLMAMLLQTLSARLGIAAGLDLAQACRGRFGQKTVIALWLLCELAIIACDLAEVLGTAIALQLLFGLPLLVGVAITAFDVFLMLALQRFGFRKLEAFIATLLVAIAGCFIYELVLARPDVRGILSGLVPNPGIVTNPAMLYIAIGILGATVMPHNLYLHSSVVQTRAFATHAAGKRQAIRHATIDTIIALSLALFINAAILVLAAATFHAAGRNDVADIADAHRLLAPMLGAGAAGVVFALALLASGQNSTITGTLAGQIVMEGFLDLRLPVWARRLVTRLLAIVPAATVIAVAGERATTGLLVLSQVVLSLQLPFAVIPLVMFTGDRALMGRFASPFWLRAVAWTAAGVILALNITLIVGIATRQ